MQKLLHLFIVIAIGILLGFSCHRRACIWDAVPYAPVAFQLYKNGELVIDSNFLATLKVFCIQNDQKVYLDIHGIADANGPDTVLYYRNRIMVLDLFPTMSVKKYFLEYPASTGFTTDTLYLDYLPPSPATDCGYKLDSITYNGIVPTNTTIPGIKHLYKFGE